MAFRLRRFHGLVAFPAAAACVFVASSANAQTVIDLTPPTGTLFQSNAPHWATKGYQLTAQQNVPVTAVDWWIVLPAGMMVSARIYNGAGVLVASGTAASGNGAEQWYRSNINYTLLAGQTYTVALYHSSGDSGTFDRKDSPSTPFSVLPQFTGLRSLSNCGAVAQQDIFPTCDNTWAPFIRVVALGCNPLNGILNAGEQCDDNNSVNGDGCDSLCRLEYCGNGTVNVGEVCDDGNTTSGDGCSSDCDSSEACGNGVVDVATGEACDDGNTTNGDGCQANCSLPECGDGIIDAAEICDDGNTTSGDGCNGTCTSDESCGNSVVDGAAGEQCDDGNSTAGDGCSALCLVEYCGNGQLDPNETCDDANVMSGDGCSSDCQSNETCGNGVVDVAAGEACDDGNTLDGDGCQGDCALPSCGDGTLDPNEVCDDGNTIGGDGCNGTCTSNESCGNFVVDGDAGEQCDDGNTVGGDGCSASCVVEFCGNGDLEANETCDDGNNLNGDGCSSDCQSNETCGNGVVDAAVGEACDDGNTTSGDGCQATCGLPSCGDGTSDPGEVCDDGNVADGDGCNTTCTSDETCGNGIVDDGEFCDQGEDNGAAGPCGEDCQPAGGGEGGGGQGGSGEGGSGQGGSGEGGSGEGGRGQAGGGEGGSPSNGGGSGDGTDDTSDGCGCVAVGANDSTQSFGLGALAALGLVVASRRPRRRRL